VDRVPDDERPAPWVSEDEEVEPLPAEVVEPIAADLVASLGYTADEARRVVQSVGAGNYGDRGVTCVAEAVQQWLHDTFLDTTWPPCPEHRTHPLWLKESGSPTWTCEETQQPHGALGQLGTILTLDEATAALNRRRLAAEEADAAAHVARSQRLWDKRRQ
jgi:hypothetical protein